MVQTQEGDSVTQEDGGIVVITPPKDTTAHNFGPVSERDSVVFTCERPGGDPPDKESLIPTGKVVPEWVDFVKRKNKISNVLILMDLDEMDSTYEAPGLVTAYGDSGMTVYHVPMGSKDASRKIMSILEDVENKGERITAHCTHGMGRSGRVAAAWLMTRYGLTSEAATDEVLVTARRYGVERMGAPKKLEAWLSK